MSFKKCFMKVFTIFSSFEVWYISPLNTWKQQDLGFACFQGGETSKLKSRKNRLKSTFIKKQFYRTSYFGKRHDMKQRTTFKNHFWKTPAIWDTLIGKKSGYSLLHWRFVSWLKQQDEISILRSCMSLRKYFCPSMKCNVDLM